MKIIGREKKAKYMDIKMLTNFLFSTSIISPNLYKAVMSFSSKHQNKLF